MDQSNVRLPSSLVYIQYHLPSSLVYILYLTTKMSELEQHCIDLPVAVLQKELSTETMYQI